MKLPDKWYDILKWITMIVIPACATAYVGLAAVWGWPYADEIAKTAAVICTLLEIIKRFKSQKNHGYRRTVIMFPISQENIMNTLSHLHGTI